MIRHYFPCVKHINNIYLPQTKESEVINMSKKIIVGVIIIVTLFGIKLFTQDQQAVNGFHTTSQVEKI